MDWWKWGMFLHVIHGKHYHRATVHRLLDFEDNFTSPESSLVFGRADANLTGNA